MSRVDWTAIEAQLNETRATTAQELEDIDAVLETVRARAAGTPTVKSKTAAPAHKNGRAKSKTKPATNGKGQRQDKITSDQLATMRTQFEAGVKVAEICKRVGVSDATLPGPLPVARLRARVDRRRPRTLISASPHHPRPRRRSLNQRATGSRAA